MAKSRLSECRIIKLPHTSNRRGNITFIDGNKDLPFKIRRLFYIYGVPEVEVRGKHAMKRAKELIICLRGSLDIVLDNGMRKKTFHLDKPYIGLYMPPLLWQELKNFSEEALCLVLSPDPYDKNGYINDYNEFRKIVLRKSKRKS